MNIKWRKNDGLVKSMEIQQRINTSGKERQKGKEITREKGDTLKKT